MFLTEKERELKWLRDNPPPDAGREYNNEDGLITYLKKCNKEEIARTASWVKIHYVNTDLLLARIRTVYKSKVKVK